MGPKSQFHLDFKCGVCMSNLQAFKVMSRGSVGNLSTMTLKKLFPHMSLTVAVCDICFIRCSRPESSNTSLCIPDLNACLNWCSCFWLMIVPTPLSKPLNTKCQDFTWDSTLEEDIVMLCTHLRYLTFCSLHYRIKKTRLKDSQS